MHFITSLDGYGAAEGWPGWWGLQGSEYLAWPGEQPESIDGFGAGPNQSLENPLGAGGESLHDWMVATRTFQQMYGSEGSTTGEDDRFTTRGFHNIGAWILGRNMFGPIRGPWPDDRWQGWWGDTPPYHAPVSVLTNHPRESIVMDGGTTFHFVTDGIHAALGIAYITNRKILGEKRLWQSI